jgi:hypothetical protein
MDLRRHVATLLWALMPRHACGGTGGFAGWKKLIWVLLVLLVSAQALAWTHRYAHAKPLSVDLQQQTRAHSESVRDSSRLFSHEQGLLCLLFDQLFSPDAQVWASAPLTPHPNGAQASEPGEERVAQAHGLFARARGPPIY